MPASARLRCQPAARSAAAGSTSPGRRGPTLGVEWEFALVDADTRDLSNEAAAVIAELGETPHVHKELLRNTVEVVTGICDTVGEAMDDLRAHARVVRRRSSASAGWNCSARAPTRSPKWSAQQLTDAPRYAELIKRTQWWGRQMLIWGVHVHVGVSSAHKVMPIISSLLNQYPHLLALSASSPFWAGDGHRLRQQPGDDVPAAAHRRVCRSSSRRGGSSRGSSTTRRRPASSITSTRSVGTSGLRRIWAPSRCASSTGCPTSRELSARWSR